jgi:hypothetical protein
MLEMAQSGTRTKECCSALPRVRRRRCSLGDYQHFVRFGIQKPSFQEFISMVIAYVWAIANSQLRSFL